MHPNSLRRSRARRCAMSLRRSCARLALPLTSCCLRLSRMALNLLRVASKFLIALAAALVAMCAWIFFTFLLPAARPLPSLPSQATPPPPLPSVSDSAASPGSVVPPAPAVALEPSPLAVAAWWLMWPFAILVVVNIYFNFFFACVTSNFSERVGADNLEDSPIDIPVCSKCNSHKPERCRHCSICKRCVHKMDHHCPWIDNCVGNNNHRYFILFLSYLMLSCIVYALFCAPYILQCVRLSQEWNFPVSRYMFAFTSWCAIAVGLVLVGMVAWNMYLIGRGRTQLEWAYSDTGSLRKYDLGYRANFSVFFNTIAFPWYYALLPRRVPPYSDGYIYPVSDQAEPEFYAL